jgi:hypothetical protein
VIIVFVFTLHSISAAPDDARRTKQKATSDAQPARFMDQDAAGAANGNQAKETRKKVVVEVSIAIRILRPRRTK